MGKALEWLGEAGCRTTAESILTDVTERGDELWAHCPWHEESTPGGAFSYSPSRDVGTCLSCGQSGDLIAVWCGIHGLPLTGAEGFLAFKKEFAAAASFASTPRRTTAPPSWTPSCPAPAPALWQDKAGAFVEHACQRLAEDKSVQAELARRGISMDTAMACKLGWNNKDKPVPRAAWGLPEETNKRTGRPKKIWLPRGLVLPIFDDGRVVKIKIRRPDPSTTWGVDLRYWEVPGGENRRYHVYGRPDWRVWVLVETERDAVLVWQEVRHLHIGAMGLGGATKRPHSDAAEILRRADVILIALDNDAAGVANALKFWGDEFPQAIYWPVPPSMGKDVGDALRDHGLPVLSWVRSGLPGYVLRNLDREAARLQRLRQPPSAVKDEGCLEDQTLPETLRELLGIVRQYPLQVDVPRTQIRVDQLWARTNMERWELYRRAAWLLDDEGVRHFLAQCNVEILTARNLDTCLRAYWADQHPQTAATVPARVKSLYTCLSKGPVRLVRDTLRLEYDQDWATKVKNWEIICRISNVLLADKTVLEWVARHPAHSISAGNFWEEQQ